MSLPLQQYHHTKMQENSVQRIAYSSKTIFFSILLFSLFSIPYSLFPQKAIAQSAISLSVSPPIFELMIQPGKEIKQVYSIINNGGNTFVIPKIVYFTSDKNDGIVNLTEDPAPEWVKYSKDPIKISNGDKTEFNVLFSPPENSEETDHFLTLYFESSVPTDLLNQNSSLYQTRIGTNILVTISKDGNPKKSAEILTFNAPTIIDSIIGKLNYKITLKNNGNSFWKPIGKIVTNQETLRIAPQNIISGSSRDLKCLENETLYDCELKKKPFIGKIVSELDFQMDDDPKIYSQNISTYVLPISPVILIMILLTIFRSREIFNVWRKRK